MKKYNILGLAIVASLGLMTSAAFAADTDLDASIVTRQAITLTEVSNLDFGTVDYAAVHSGSVILGTNGIVSVTGSGLTSKGSPTAGNIQFSGDGSSTVEIACENSAILSDGNGNALALSAVEFSTTGGQAAGAGTPCGGLGIVSDTLDLAINPVATLLVGATLDANINSAANYTTAQAGGNPVTFRVVYQ